MYKCIRELTEIIFVTRSLVDAHIKVNTLKETTKRTHIGAMMMRARGKESSLSRIMMVRRRLFSSLSRSNSSGGFL